MKKTFAGRCFQIGCTETIMFGKNVCEKCHWHKCNEGHCLCTLSDEARYVAEVVEATTIHRLESLSVRTETK